MRKIKSGLSSAAKYPDRPMRELEQMTLAQRAKRHKENHPNDKGEPRKNKGITLIVIWIRDGSILNIMLRRKKNDLASDWRMGCH